MFALPQANYDPNSAKAAKSPMAGDDKQATAAQPALVKKKSWFGRQPTVSDAPPVPPSPAITRESHDTDGSTLIDTESTGTSEEHEVKVSDKLALVGSRGGSGSSGIVVDSAGREVSDHLAASREGKPTSNLSGVANATQKGFFRWPFMGSPKPDTKRTVSSPASGHSIPRSGSEISVTRTTKIEASRARDKSDAKLPENYFPGGLATHEKPANTNPRGYQSINSIGPASTGRKRAQSTPKGPDVSQSGPHNEGSMQHQESATSTPLTPLPPMFFGRPTTTTDGRGRAKSSPKRPELSIELHSASQTPRLISSPSLVSTAREFAPATPSSLRTVSTPTTTDHVPADPQEDFELFLRGQELGASQTASPSLFSDPRFPREETATYSREPVQIAAQKRGRKVKTEKKVLIQQGYAVEQYVSGVDPDSPGLPSADLATHDPAAWKRCVDSAKRQIQVDQEQEQQLANELLIADSSPTKHKFYDEKRSIYERFQHQNLVRIGESLASRASVHYGLELKDHSQAENSYRQLGKGLRDMHEDDGDMDVKVTGLLPKFFRKAEKKDGSTSLPSGQPRTIPRKSSLQHLAQKFKLSPKPPGEGEVTPLESFSEVHEDFQEQLQPRLRENFDGSSSFAASSIYEDDEMAGLGITTVETSSSGYSGIPYGGYRDDPAKAISPPSIKPPWETMHFNHNNPSSTSIATTQGHKLNRGSELRLDTSSDFETSNQDIDYKHDDTPAGSKIFIMERPSSRHSIHSGETEYADADDWEDVPNDLVDEANAAGTTPQLQQHSYSSELELSSAEEVVNTLKSARDRGSILILDRGLAHSGPISSRSKSVRKGLSEQIRENAVRREAKQVANAVSLTHPANRSQAGDAPTPTRSADPGIRRLMDELSPAIPTKSSLRISPPKYGGPTSPGKRFTPVKDQIAAIDGSGNLNALPQPLPRPNKLAPSVNTTPSEQESTTAQADTDQYQHSLSSQSPLENQIDTMMDKWNEATPDMSNPATFGERKDSKTIPPSIAGLQHLRHKIGLPLLKEKSEADRPHPNHPYVWETINIMCYGVHNPISRESSLTSTTTSSQESPLARLSGRPDAPTPHSAPKTGDSSSSKGVKCFYCGCTCCYYKELEQLAGAGFVRDPDTRKKIETARQHVSMLREHSTYQYGIEKYDTNLSCSSCNRVFCPEHGNICEYLTCRAALCFACAEENNGGYCEEHFLVSPVRSGETGLQSELSRMDRNLEELDRIAKG